MKTWKVFDFKVNDYVGSVILKEDPRAGDIITLNGQRYRVTQFENSKEHGQELGVSAIHANSTKD